MAETVASPIRTYLEGLHAKYAAACDGQVATYIPELAKADPNWFGICIATTDGRVYEIGDTAQPFTLQSLSKPLVYGLLVGRQASRPNATSRLELKDVHVSLTGEKK